MEKEGEGGGNERRAVVQEVMAAILIRIGLLVGGNRQRGGTCAAWALLTQKRARRSDGRPLMADADGYE